MNIAGLTKTTLLDYPEHVAATIFVAGCNFRCPFCHNATLVLPDMAAPTHIDEAEVFSFLEKRKNVLSAVCISGGEPTLAAGLPSFIRQIKELGYLVKLDTNGSRPDVLAALFSEGLLDYVAMDIKHTKGQYATACGAGGTAVDGGAFADLGKIEASMALLRDSGIAHEFRTTVVRELHDEADLLEIGEWIKGGAPWYLQTFVDNGTVIKGGFNAYGAERMEEFSRMLSERGVDVRLRGDG